MSYLPKEHKKEKKLTEKQQLFLDKILETGGNLTKAAELAGLNEIPAYTVLSEKISKDLKQKGFSFVGPTVVYSYMQATGMVNDHLESCFRHSEVILKR